MAPASTEAAEPETDFKHVLGLIERCQLLARADAAERELELRTSRAFFDHLVGRPVDPRITRRFAMQSSGWRVPWSASAPLNPGQQLGTTRPENGPHVEIEQVPEQVLSRMPDAGPVEYVRLGRARSLRGG